MLEPLVSGAFKRDLKACRKRHWDMAELEAVMNLILKDTDESRSILRRDYRDHALKGNWKGTRECHVADLGDWVLIYAVERGVGHALFVGTGTHDQFFRAHSSNGRWPTGT